MDNSSKIRLWKVLSWNVRGLNSEKKWDAIRDKIVESGCDIVCLQETKRETFDLQFLRKFCPKSFDAFEFLPSVGASGGVITIWKSHLFDGSLIFSNDYGISVEFTSKHNAIEWVLTNIYAPCTSAGKVHFLNWFKEIQMPPEILWMILGDFNLLRSPEVRNCPDGDVNEMLHFNESISALDLIEIPLKGKRFTWSNKQHPPLLERLDWFFTSSSWTSIFPSTSASTLNMETSDHVPWLVFIATDIPKGAVFIFENYLMEHENFLEVVHHRWSIPTHQTDMAKRLTTKFKNLRRVIKS